MDTHELITVAEEQERDTTRVPLSVVQGEWDQTLRRIAEVCDVKDASTRVSERQYGHILFNKTEGLDFLPVEAILFRMDEQGLRQKDIADIVGGKNRASEVLSRKRPLTLAMVRALHEKLGIPSELLIQEPRAEYRVERKSSRTKRG